MYSKSNRRRAAQRRSSGRPHGSRALRHPPARAPGCPALPDPRAAACRGRRHGPAAAAAAARDPRLLLRRGTQPLLPGHAQQHRRRPPVPRRQRRRPPAAQAVGTRPHRAATRWVGHQPLTRPALPVDRRRRRTPRSPSGRPGRAWTPSPRWRGAGPSGACRGRGGGSGRPSAPRRPLHGGWGGSSRPRRRRPTTSRQEAAAPRSSRPPRGCGCAFSALPSLAANLWLTAMPAFPQCRGRLGVPRPAAAGVHDRHGPPGRACAPQPQHAGGHGGHGHRGRRHRALLEGVALRAVHAGVRARGSAGARAARCEPLLTLPLSARMDVTLVDV